ncbi:hypothetical protein [Porphyromonas sp.]|uniref:hypothetical protein n=1 Tax=Porphyromonas sp. TaxID=1924944 RepID=UPI0026DC643D|nr:hypothetical protein [Porphyromonas sp.]MDO4695869.1 hypothetical protein [Porphyromonas sp.]MDO4770349.1 hypothetical protein [Porphyromonas sp.]
MRLTKHQLGGAFLSLIMILYLGRVMGLTHAHIINGVIVVHSHPDYWDNNDDPFVDHSATQLVFFHQVANLFACVGGFFSPIVPDNVFADFRISFSDRLVWHIPSYSDGGISLRAPPSL